MKASLQPRTHSRFSNSLSTAPEKIKVTTRGALAIKEASYWNFIPVLGTGDMHPTTMFSNSEQSCLNF